MLKEMCLLTHLQIEQKNDNCLLQNRMFKDVVLDEVFNNT